MKVLTCTTPGYFEYNVSEKPVLIKGHAIIRIKRVGICGTDIHALKVINPSLIIREC